MDHAAFRAQFPVLAERAYLNAGACGPLPRAAADAVAAAARRAAHEGRAKAYYDTLWEARDRLRAAYAMLLGVEASTVSVTSSTAEGIVRVLLGIGLRRNDEVLVAEDEHPSLLGPLAALRDRIGISVREVPLADLPGAVGPRTRLVACSHVAWTSGALCPSFAGLPDDLPVLLDGAQGAGAVPVDLDALGCAFYAASGQKWLCGPIGTGLLRVASAWRDRLAAVAPTYMNLAVPAEGLRARAAPDGRAYDATVGSAEAYEGALAALGVLAGYGLDTVLRDGPRLAAAAADALRAAGREVLPRDDTTLVSWVSPDAEAEVARLLEAGVVVRSFPGLPFVRASVGAWNDQSDVERLLSTTGPGS